MTPAVQSFTDHQLSLADGSLPHLQGLGFDAMKLEAGVRRVNIAEKGFDPTSARLVSKEELRRVLQGYMDTAWNPKQDNPYLSLLEISNVSWLEISTPGSSSRITHQGDVLLRWGGHTGGIGIESLAGDGQDRFGFFRSKKESVLIEIPDRDERFTYFNIHLAPASKPELTKAHGRLTLSFSDAAITQYAPINGFRRYRDISSDPFYSEDADKHIGVVWHAIWREAGIPDATTLRKGEIRDFGTGITFNYRDGHSYKELIANFDRVMPGELLSRMVRGLRHVNPQSLESGWIGESGGHEAGCYLDIKESGKHFSVHTSGAEAMLRLIIQMRTVAALYRNGQ